MMDLKLYSIPNSSRLLLLSAIFSLTNALPRPGPDVTATYKPADWNPRPTNAPGSPLPELLKRDASGPSVCGWFNGDFNQPSQCASDQECVYDTNHAVIGCCPLSGSCTTGVYTTCVNYDQGAINPSVLTCSGESACYQNTYPEGYYQYACGASTDAQTVATTYTNEGWSLQLQIIYTQLTLITTEPATSILPSTVAASQTSSDSSSFPSSSSSASALSSSTSSSLSSSPSSSTSSTIPSSTLLTATSATSQTLSSSSVSAGAQLATSTATATAATSGSGSQSNVGIIAGSVVGGLGVIFALLALSCVLIRRRRNRRAEERTRSIANREKTLSMSSYASSQMSDHPRSHPFSPDDIVSPLTPPQEPAPALVQPAVFMQPKEEDKSMVETKDLEIKHSTPRDTFNVQQPIETEHSNVRRVQLEDGPSIDDIADLPLPWVRPPTPPPRSPKRLSIRVHPPEDQTPLDIYLKAQSSPIHHSVSVTSNTTDTSRYSRAIDGSTISDSIDVVRGERGEAPPMTNLMPIVRKPVGSGWYRSMSAVTERKSDDHVAFQLAGNSDIGRSLTAQPQVRERSNSMFSQESADENSSFEDSIMSAPIFELDVTGNDDDWIAPLRLSTSNNSPVTKRGRTPVPILEVPAAPSPGGRGRRLYEV